MNNIVLVSYVPLLQGDAGRIITDPDPAKIAKTLEAGPTGNAVACVWLMSDDGTPSPCLVIENAKEIAEHLIEWAEKKPEEWFNLSFVEYDGLYGLALMPRVELGVERFKVACLLRNGYPIPKNADIHVIFKPLHFMSGKEHMFSKVKPLLKASAEVRLIDVSLVDRYNISATDWDKSISLGSFAVIPDNGYILQQLQENLFPSHT